MFYGYWLASFTEILKTCSFLNSIYSSKAALYNIKHKNLPLVCVKKKEWCKHKPCNGDSIYLINNAVLLL